MRKYLLLILFISIGLGQDVLTTNSGTVYTGEMIKADYYKVQFKADGMPSVQDVNIKSIKKLILSDGTEIVKNGFLIKRNFEKEKDDPLEYLIGTSLTRIGGTFIGLSGVILYSNNQREIGKDATVGEAEAFVDKSKSNTNLASIFLAIGGALIAIDN